MENERSDMKSGRGESLSPDGHDEADLPPEYCQYRDDGCEFADSCLSCPLPKCIYELPGGRQRWLKEVRDREILRRFVAEGKGVKEVALIFGVSQRTIQRVLKRAKNESNPYSRAVKES
jgi:hypothetical protein